MTPYTDSCHWTPWTQELEDQFTFESRYDGKIQCFTTNNDGQIGLPRGALPLGTDGRDVGQHVQFVSNFKPQRPEQPSVIAKSVALLKDDKQFLIQAPTGWGKTFVGTEIAGQMQRRFCVITTKEDSLNDWVNAIKTTLNLTADEVGVWRGDNVPRPDHKAVVALIQSVAKGPDRYGEDAFKNFGLVMCDEVHRMGADHFSQAMWHFPSKYRLGLSATPYRRDGKDQVFFWHIGPVMVEAHMEVHIPKVLVQKTNWKIPVNRKKEQIPHEMGNISLLMKPLCRNPPRNLLIIKYIKSALEKGRSTIAFSDNLEHLEAVSDLLRAQGVAETDIGFYVGLPNTIYGKSKKLQEAMRKGHTYRPILLATYKMGSEATNLPWLDTCVLLTPRADVNQPVGRIRREYENKKFPLVVDFMDDDSFVLKMYAKKRLSWYKELGCEVIGYS